MRTACLLVLCLAACGPTNPCRDGTLLVTAQVPDALAATDVIEISVTVLGEETHSARVSRRGEASGTIEVTFPSGYPEGKIVNVALHGIDAGGAEIASGQTSRQLGAGCDQATITLAAPSMVSPRDCACDGSCGQPGDVVAAGASCPAGTVSVLDAHRGLVATGCGGGSCTCTPQAACEVDLSEHNNLGCMTGTPQLRATVTSLEACRDINGVNGLVQISAARLSKPTCAVAGGASAPLPTTWDGDLRFCAVAPSASCATPPRCVLLPGDIACPTGYDPYEGGLHHSGTVDDRSCACTCGVVMGTGGCAGGTITFGEDDVCGGATDSASVPSTGNNNKCLNSTRSSVKLTGSVLTLHSCAAGGTVLAGSARPSGPLTVCCRP